jgi:lipid-binding SYLF domain-containing protein
LVKNSSARKKKVDSASKQANAAPPAQAKTQLASIRFKVFKAGLIFGVGGGEGVLTFKGKKYPINVSGVSLGLSIGISKADMVGEVLNLKESQRYSGHLLCFVFRACHGWRGGYSHSKKCKAGCDQD